MLSPLQTVLSFLRTHRIISAALAGLLVVSCWRLVSSRSDDSLELSRGETGLRIGYAVEQPFAYAKGAEVTGEAPEIAKKACFYLGISKVDWVQMPFDSLLNGLERERCDVIASGMFITRERAERVAFSLPTLLVKPAFLVRAGNPRGLFKAADIREKSGLRIAVLSGSVEEKWVKQLKPPGNLMLGVPDAVTGSYAVYSGSADVLILSSLSVRRMVSERSGLEAVILEPIEGLPEGQAAFVFRKEDKALREAWDGFLKGFIGSTEHQQLLSELNLGDTELPVSGGAMGGAAP